MLERDGKGVTLKKCQTSFPSGCEPELDLSEELNEDVASRHLQMVGVLRWGVELGRVGVPLETLRWGANPRVRRLETAHHVFGCWVAHPRSKLVFDPAEPVVDESAFRGDVDWEPFCGDVEEEMPPFMPKPRGDPASVCCFVDANRAGSVVARRSHTGILIFINRAPVPWFSKKQNAAEPGAFGSEFVALRAATEQIKALQHKLRMFGVPSMGPVSAFCDNHPNSDPLDRLRDRACSLNAPSVLWTLGQCVLNNWLESEASRSPAQSRPHRFEAAEASVT
jgi:hypothetical protein